MITTLIVALWLQVSGIPLRSVAENPAVVTPPPKKIQKDYDKLWQRFKTGKDDTKLMKDLDKLLKKNPGQVPLIVLEAYVDIYNNRAAEGEAKLQAALRFAATNRIALSYLAEFAFSRADYAQAADLYGRLLEADPSRTDVETKRQKALIVATENLLRHAGDAERANRVEEAESLYRQALRIAPREPSLHERLGSLLGSQKKWEEALAEFQKEREFSLYPNDADTRIAEALANLGRTEEARAIVERLKKSGNVDAALEGKIGELTDIGRWGQDIARFREIQAAAAISRAQAATLFVRYFPQVAEFRQTPQVITDVQTSWALPEILITVGIGLLEARPNHTFEPFVPVTRLEFAAALARMTRLLRLPAPPAPAVPLTDIGPRNALYRDVQLVLAMGLMQIDDSGAFASGQPVSGEKAVGSVEQLLTASRK
jgi:tetratricopeptide (TPR) repeat protein